MNQGLTITMHTYNPQPMSLPSIHFLCLTFAEILPRQDFQTQGHSGKVKSRPQHNIAHLHPPNQCPYQVSSSYILQFLRQLRQIFPAARPVIWTPWVKTSTRQPLRAVG